MWHEKIMRVRTESGRNLWCSLECSCLLLIGWQVLSWCAFNITRRLSHNSTTVAPWTKQMKPSTCSCLVNILQGNLMVRTGPIPRKSRKVKIFGHYSNKWRVISDKTEGHVTLYSLQCLLPLIDLFTCPQLVPVLWIFVLWGILNMWSGRGLLWM